MIYDFRTSTLMINFTVEIKTKTSKVKEDESEQVKVI
jgi:hypothetical protein|nr:MAG TPA: hypothetical protein [Caudoviricetes sp.]